MRRIPLMAQDEVASEAFMTNSLSGNTAAEAIATFIKNMFAKVKNTLFTLFAQAHASQNCLNTANENIHGERLELVIITP